MPIGTERTVVIEKQAACHAVNGIPGSVFPYRIQCRACGFEPADALVAPRRCPKCAGNSWEQFAIPRSLLMYAERSTRERVAPSSPAPALHADLHDWFV